MKTEVTEPRARYGGDEVTLLQVIAVPLKRWRVVAGFLLVAALLAAAFLLLRPDSYAARTVLVPTTDRSAGRAAMVAGQLPAGLGAMLPSSNPQEKLVGAVLKSRTLADSLVRRSGYVPHGGSAGEREVRELVRKRMRVHSHPDGSLTVEVRDRDPERATRFANQVPGLANAILAELVRDGSVRKQEFLGDQVRHASDQLEASERELVAFQRAQDAPELQEQARQTMEAAARLQQEIIEREVRVAQLRRVATPDNPEYRAAVAELNDWRSQLLRLTSGQTRESQVFLSLRESPELRATATRMLREYTKNEQVYLTLASALAEANLDVQNELPILSVLDAAIVPASPAGLPPVLVLLLALCAGLLSGLVAAYLVEYVQGAREDPGSQEFFVAWDDFVTDFRGISSRRRGRARPSEPIA
jgi:uncharacterized protein involved in exopolysaccharide biosynthesis